MPTQYWVDCGNNENSVFRVFEDSDYPHSVGLQFEGREENNLHAKRALLENIDCLKLF